MSLESYWMASAPPIPFPRLQGSVRVDVCVIGGGIAGLSAAHELRQRGRTVAVVEAGRVAASVTGYTTAKITSLHTTIYGEISAKHGEDKARLYGEAQQAGLDRIRHWASALSIDCDLETQDAYTYAVDEEGVEDLRKEAETAASLGLPASFVTSTPLPFDVAGAVRFTGQAQFHPRKYLLALAAGIPGDGSHLFEQTRMVDVREGEPCTVVCEEGEVVADDVVLATHYPVLDRGLMFARVDVHRDVVVAGLLPDGVEVDGMHISTEEATHSVRTAPHPDGRLLIVGGEPSKTGKETDVQARYDRLARWTAERFGVADLSYRWSTQDNMTADGVPYIGRFHMGAEHVWVATGFRGWGMTNGAVTGMLLADLVTGAENPWEELFDPRRVKPVASAKTVVGLQVEAVKGLVVDGLKPAEVDSVDEIGPGEGAIARVDGDKAAVYRDEQGALHCLSHRCTHLGCVVRFNNAEKSWDCPCHGSRFAVDGSVLQGPANKSLERRDAPVGSPSSAS